jgi:putative nucleotidyltransferase with HDIG domain
MHIVDFVHEAVSGGTANDGPNATPFSELIPALSFALDLAEDRPMGHVLRSCIIGMHIGERILLSQEQLTDLFRALLLKDVGCSSDNSRLAEMTACRRFHRSSDSPRCKQKDSKKELAGSLFEQRNHESIARYRCERAARISGDLGLSLQVAEALYEMEERWDGSGYPNRLQGNQISLIARIISIAQTLDMAAQRFGNATAIDIVSRRCGTWFDKDLVAASNLLHSRSELWEDLEFPDLISRVKALNPAQKQPCEDSFPIDNICVAFAEVVDAKSPFTFTHSTNVARLVVQMADLMGHDSRQTKLIQRAALLHDIGKLGVPTSVLEKPGILSPSEWTLIRQHPKNTKAILDKIPGFNEISSIAALHHEKLDGSGYPYGLGESDIPFLARILTTADIYDALSSSRPYRCKLAREEVLKLMRRDVPNALNNYCLEALAIASQNVLQQTR